MLPLGLKAEPGPGQTRDLQQSTQQPRQVVQGCLISWASWDSRGKFYLMSNPTSHISCNAVTGLPDWALWA